MSTQLTDQDVADRRIPAAQTAGTTDATVDGPGPPARATPAKGGGMRSALRLLRTLVVVTALLAAAAGGGTYIVRQRLAAAAFVDVGTAVLTADPVPVGSADAGVVTEMLVAEQARVTAGQDLARITLTVNGTSAKPPEQILRAPVAGTVSRVNVVTGGVVRAGEPVVTLYNQNSSTFQVQIPMKQLRRLRIGMLAAVTGDGLTRPVSARLDHVVAQVGARAGTDSLTVVLVPVRDDVERVSRLIPGLQFDAVIDTRTASGATPAVNSA